MEEKEKCCHERIDMNDISLYATRDAYTHVMNNSIKYDRRDTYLLSQTDMWTWVKWKEYEGVGCKVFAQTIAKGSIRIEF